MIIQSAGTPHDVLYNNNIEHASNDSFITDHLHAGNRPVRPSRSAAVSAPPGSRLHPVPGVQSASGLVHRAFFQTQRFFDLRHLDRTSTTPPGSSLLIPPDSPGSAA